MTTLQTFITQAHPCSYLNDKQAQLQVLAPTQLPLTQTYPLLIHHNFRRSGDALYRPHCPSCQACMSVRIDCAEFSPNRSQKRIFKQHQHLQARISALDYHPDDFALYQRYQQQRHATGDMQSDAPEDYQKNLLHKGAQSKIIRFYDAQNTLKIVSIVDVLPDGLSAVYTFYAPEDPKTAYGIYAILWQIAYAQQCHLAYVYLGYWVENSLKMAYKRQFNALSYCADGQWRAFTTP